MLLLNLHTPSNDLQNSVFALTSGDYTYVVDEQDNTKVKIMAYTGTISTLVVPSTLEDKTVNEIGDEAFANNNSLVNVTIPNSVTKIGSSIFAGCKNLESITIPFMGDQNYQTVQTNQDDNAGEDDWKEECCNRSIIYWFEKTEYVDENGRNADFYWLFNDEIWFGCYLPKNLTTISLTNCKVINYDAYYWGDGDEYPINTINLPNTLLFIGEAAFNTCSNLTAITIPKSVTSIHGSAFQSCESLTLISIPSNVTTLSSMLFSGCSNLSTIAISQNVTSIGDYAFQYCTNLAEITIPYNVESIGDRVFTGCENLTTVRCLASVPPTLGEYVFEDIDLTTIQVYEDVVGAYQNSAWGELGATIVGIPRPTFPNTGVGVDIILPSAIIFTLTISIVFVAFGGKKKVIVKK